MYSFSCKVAFNSCLYQPNLTNHDYSMNCYSPLSDSECFITGDGDEGCTEEVLKLQNVTTYIPKLSPSRFQAKSDNLEVHPDELKVCGIKLL